MNKTIVNNGLNCNKAKSKTTLFLKKVNIEPFMTMCKFKKIEGIPCIDVLKKCIELVFTNKSWNRTIKTEAVQDNVFQKDVIYRFLNSNKYLWESLLEVLSIQAINIINRLTSNKRIKALIFDDSFYDRSRSKKVELLSSVYDHTDGKYKKGFTLFTMGWSDSFSYIPIFFQLLASKESSRNYASKINEKETDIQKKRRNDALKSKPEILIEMVKKSILCRIPFRYVLFDSWFAFPAIIASVYNENKNVITMLKRLKNIHYTYKGKSNNLMEIYKKIKSKLTKKCLRVSIIVTMKDKERNKNIQVQIVFARDEKSEKWVALLSTNTKISADEVIRIYGIRWNIEVFFKICKSYLKLAKEFMGRSFDMLIAHTTIVFLRYIMLSLSARENKDDKSIGDLFFASCDEIKDISFFEAFEYLINFLISMIAKKMKKDVLQIEKMVISFLHNLPLQYQKYFMRKSCET